MIALAYLFLAAAIVYGVLLILAKFRADTNAREAEAKADAVVAEAKTDEAAQVQAIDERLADDRKKGALAYVNERFGK